MNDVAMAPSTAQRGYGTRTRSHHGRLSLLEALERGFALFRSTFAGDAWRYYVGTAPLVVALIPMWVIDGQIRISNGTLLLQALLLAGGYAFRVWMVRSYARRIRERAFGTRTSKPTGTLAKAADLGRLLMWKAALSVFALVTLPTVAWAAWFYTACQFASLEAADDGAGRQSFSGCLALAGQWFGGSVLLFVSLFPLWIAVWLNGMIVALLVPQLLHSIFGVNTLLSTAMGVFALIQSSAFWLSLFAGAWLAVDPVVKCTFVIVYQHLRSRREGDDLRGLLANLPRSQQKSAWLPRSNAKAGGVMTVGLLLLCAVSLSATSRAQRATPAIVAAPQKGAAGEARIQTLRSALSAESQRAVYRWHDAEHPEPPTWFDRLLEKIGKRIQKAWDGIWNFLHKLWPSGLNLSPGSDRRAWQFKDLLLWLILLAVVTIAGAGALVWLRRRKQAAALSIPLSVMPIPDLSDVAAASERSEDEWFALASRLQGEGELRLALRAAYFALLSGLAQREWLTIRRDRTNREYLDEFTRRWRRRPQAAMDVRAEIPEKLRGSLRVFDRVWYGSHGLTPEVVVAYRQEQREFLNHV